MQSNVKTLTGENSCVKADTYQVNQNGSVSKQSNGGTCGYELSNFLSSTDQAGITGTQNVSTFTIGFNTNGKWLENMSTVYGKGDYYTANTSAQLTSVFDKIIKTIKASNSSFSQPGITVNNLNRLSHREDVYYSMFKPSETQHWLGNVKKYRVDGELRAIVDADGNPAVDPQTGFFSANATSYWSDEQDGLDVSLGGAAGDLPAPDDRKLFSYFGNYPVTNTDTVLLTEPNNLVVEANANLNHAILGITGQDNTYRTNLVRWIRGEYTDGSRREQVGDPLHSIPVIMTYSVDEANDTIDSTIFVGTNEGFIHAIDANTGAEQFAFIPRELLANLDVIRHNSAIGVGSKVYGIDGELTLITNDENNDGDFEDINDGDYAWLYAGMRRGGRNYYALDVSNVKQPKIKWSIQGGTGGTTGFEELGQTWSKPTEIEVNYDGNRKTLLLFAGGYDAAQDSKNTRSADTMGRAIYMVDPDTGALFWSAGLTNSSDLQLADMNYSIPSNITAIDINLDGLIDQFYVGDMGGQIWRFDVHNGKDQKADLVTGGVIADLGGNDIASNRRFYYAPDLSYTVDGENKVLALGIGSGWRAHPLDENVLDRLFVIKQFDNIFSAPSTYTKRTTSDLYDTTANLIQLGDTQQKEEAALALSSGGNRTAEGWYINLTNPGEKVLAKSVTVNEEIIFPTYEPEPPDTVQCQPVQGTSRTYILDLLTGAPVRDLTGDGNLNNADRVVQLNQGSIPATPKIIDPESGAPIILIGPEVLDEADTGRQIRKTYWREMEE